MPRISLRKVQSTDKKYFAKWWRDKKLISLTSGVFDDLSDSEIGRYFGAILDNTKDFHFIITLDREVIGHLVLSKRARVWHELQIIIGQAKYRGKGFGTKAIKSLIGKAKSLGVAKIYLEVRPNNAVAIRVYEKCGFQAVARVLYPSNKALPETLRMQWKSK